MQNLPLHVYSAFQTTDRPDELLHAFQKYMTAEHYSAPLQYDVIKKISGAELRYYKTDKQAEQHLFIIPSVINGSEIFDLHPSYSFISYMLSCGIDVYLLDWGNMEHYFKGNLEDIFSQILTPLWRCANDHCHTQLHALGYCLGGSLAAKYFSEHQKNTLPASVTFLATPFDFNITNAPWDYVLQDARGITNQIRLQGALTQRMLQAHFLHLNPHDTISKFHNFLKMPKDSIEEQRFIAVERWLNEGSDVPDLLAIDLVEKFFIHNDALLSLTNFPDIPLAFISSDRDQIVPASSSEIILTIKPKIHHIKTDCGHVGMMVGKNAKRSVWTPFTEFIIAAATQQN